MQVPTGLIHTEWKMSLWTAKFTSKIVVKTIAKFPANYFMSLLLEQSTNNHVRTISMIQVNEKKINPAVFWFLQYGFRYI